MIYYALFKTILQYKEKVHLNQDDFLTAQTAFSQIYVITGEALA